MHSLIMVSGKEIRVQGGLLRIARLEADKYQFADDPEAMLAGLRKCGTRVDLFTFLQRLPKELPESSTISPSYSHPMEWDNLAVLPVSTFDNWWTKQIENKTRNMARRAEKKGVAVREVPFDDELVKGIWEIYNESPLRQGKPFPHYGKNIETVYREEATFLDSSVFLGAFLEKRLIGFIKLVFDESRMQAGMMNVLSLVGERDKAPTNALVAQAVRSCAERGFSYLIYAGFAYGRKQSSSLSDFKEHNGFKRIDLPRYYVPLTRTGGMAFRLGLHRRLTDHIPESLAARFRELRDAWYR
jgi:hypothetical protein